jgi:hypothetical protein
VTESNQFVCKDLMWITKSKEINKQISDFVDDFSFSVKAKSTIYNTNQWKVAGIVAIKIGQNSSTYEFVPLKCCIAWLELILGQNGTLSQHSSPHPKEKNQK